MNGGEHDMGMLMHHTWLKQQEEAKKKAKAEAPADPVVDNMDEYDVPVKRAVNRRKASKE